MKSLKEKQLLLDLLKKTPIIQNCCEKLNINRATFYRWKTKDKIFSKQVDEALAEGNNFVNDFCENQLISAIKDGNLQAISLWLRTHNSTYSNKIEVINKNKVDDEKLNPEQEKLITKALEMVKDLPALNEGGENDKHTN